MRAVAALLCSLMLLTVTARADSAQDGAEPATFALVGAEIRTVSHGTHSPGTLVVRGREIVAVGPADSTPVPDGAEVREVSGRVIIPGLVDSHSHVGVYPRPQVQAHADGNELTGPVQSQLRALDAIWPADPGIAMARAGGVTTANIMPGSGNVFGGQTAYVKLRGGTVGEMLIAGPGEVQGGLKMANGENPKRVYGERKQAPATRMGVAAVARAHFVEAQRYVEAWAEYEKKKSADGDEEAKPPDRNLGLESVAEVLRGERTVHHHTHRSDDIMTVLRLREEFGFDLVLQHVTEGYVVAKEIAAAGVGASIILLDSPGGKLEAAEYTHENGGVLERAGVPVAIHTDDFVNSSRLFLRSGAFAVRGGMSEAGALRALTLEPARMLRLDDRIGSLEPGKDADFVVLSGEPFSTFTHVLETWIEGERHFDRAEPAQRRFATGGFGVGDAYPELKARATTGQGPR